MEHIQMTDHSNNSSMIEILQTLHEGGTINQFSSGKVYLTNIFGELINFPAGSFELLYNRNWSSAFTCTCPVANVIR